MYACVHARMFTVVVAHVYTPIYTCMSWCKEVHMLHSY